MFIDETPSGLNPPDVLIHLHVRKTGGTSLSRAIKHAFRRHEVFELYAHGDPEDTALGIASLESVSESLHQFGLGRVRYISGHVPYGVHRLFGARAKYFTLVRDPVERVISTFFWFQRGSPFCRAGKSLSFEEYVEGRDDIYLNNYQVRVLSGSAELDGVTPETKQRELIFGPPVERRHLEQAKRNVEDHFLIAAPLERLTESALMLRLMYCWPTRRLYNEYKNQTPDRPRTSGIPSRLIKIIEDCNAYDAELFNWVRNRFAAQSAMFEPQLSEDLEIYQRNNRVLSSAGKYLPYKVRKQLAATILHGRGLGFNFFQRNASIGCVSYPQAWQQSE